MGMSEFLRLFCSEYSPKLLRTLNAVAWLHPSLPFAVFLPPCGVSFFSTILQEGRCFASSTSVGARGAFSHIISSSARAAQQLLPRTGPLLHTQAGVYSARVIFRVIQLPPWRPSVPLVLHFIFHCCLLSKCFILHFHILLLLLYLIELAHF